MHDRCEEGFTVGGIDGNDRMSSIGRPEHDELGTAIGLPTEEAARNAMLRHWAVIGLDTDPAVGKRNNVEPVLDQRALGGSSPADVGIRHSSLAPRRLQIRAVYPRRGSPSRGP